MHILVICSGNMCRSPMAEGILREELNPWEGIHQVSSAGTLGFDGNPPIDNAIIACHEIGLDIADLAATPFDSELVEKVDLILGMEDMHREKALALGASPNKVKLLGEFDPFSPPDPQIPDPIGQPLPAFRICRDRIFRCIKGFIQKRISQDA